MSHSADLYLHNRSRRHSTYLDFLTDRPQVVSVDRHTSFTLILNIGAPQGCVLSPLLYSLYTHDCVATFDSNAIVKFVGDTAMVGLITDNNEKANLKEAECLALWCQDNNLLLNVSKELIMDFGKKQGRKHAPLNINGSSVERVDSFKYLGIHITEGLTRALHTDCGEGGKAETVSTQMLEEILDIPSDTEEFLLLHH